MSNIENCLVICFEIFELNIFPFLDEILQHLLLLMIVDR
jgi:hypothetical protein